MKKIVMVCILILRVTMPDDGLANIVADYLILTDIGPYKFVGKGKGGHGSGILTQADHFGEDHTDESYRGSYIDRAQKIGVKIQITKHAGFDSDKWLLHELESSYRDNDNSDSRLGLLSGAGVKTREIGGNKFIYWGLGGGSYSWISGQKVIEIKYTDLQRTKPEPIEVIEAYLQKHPSTIPSTFVLDQAHDVQWIKDEMDRRLWLCDKWFYQLQLEKVQQSQALQESVKSMKIFLDYREKYYGIKAAEEKNLLAGYLSTNNGTGIKNKLAEYKAWWAANKEKQINL